MTRNIVKALVKKFLIFYYVIVIVSLELVPFSYCVTFKVANEILDKYY